MGLNVPSDLAADYRARWDVCHVRLERLATVNTLAVWIQGLRPRYDVVAAATGVPWWFIATVHSLEASLSFKGHLHNGDPLTARTVHVPKGLPATGNQPFTWEVSAVDALRYKHLDQWRDWSVEGALYKLELYNGMGYRHLPHPIPSPYLWSFSDQYTAGKYVSDGHYDPTAVSHQIGGATLWKRMVERGAIELV